MGRWYRLAIATTPIRRILASLEAAWFSFIPTFSWIGVQRRFYQALQVSVDLLFDPNLPEIFSPPCRFPHPPFDVLLIAHFTAVYKGGSQ
jgi:hypothetical protein